MFVVVITKETLIIEIVGPFVDAEAAHKYTFNAPGNLTDVHCQVVKLNHP